MVITLFLYLAVSAASYGDFKGRGKKERRKKKKRASLSTVFFCCCWLLLFVILLETKANFLLLSLLLLTFPFFFTLQIEFVLPFLFTKM